jgi:hypothetical protein
MGEKKPAKNKTIIIAKKQVDSYIPMNGSRVTLTKREYEN